MRFFKMNRLACVFAKESCTARGASTIAASGIWESLVVTETAKLTQGLYMIALQAAHGLRAASVQHVKRTAMWASP